MQERSPSEARADAATGRAVLIVALSGRALALAARRGGYVPLVADLFGDDDTRALAARFVLAGSYADGFAEDRLEAALQVLVHGYAVEGLVWGAGFEDRPELLDMLARTWPLLGNSGGVVRNVKDPRWLADACHRSGIPHPDIAFEHPDDEHAWLAKRVGGSGGSHVGSSGGPGHYWQRRASGHAVSAAFLADGRGAEVVAYTEQWTDPAPDAPYRYGGAVRPTDLSPSLTQALAGACDSLAREAGLVGLNSLDVLVDGDRFTLLEINPRPGATLDVLDDDEHRLFAAHVAGCRGEVLRHAFRFSQGSAAAVVYADEDIVSVPCLDWPDWAFDRQPAGSFVPKGAPFCTVTATEQSAAKARATVTGRSKVMLERAKANSDGKVPSVSTRARALADAMVRDADLLRIKVSTGSRGERLIDCGSETKGGIEAGVRMAEICLGGLGTVTVVPDATFPNWPFSVSVRSSQPVIACLGSQYAGWKLQHGSFFALGSGPARALAQKEEIYKEIGYRDDADGTVLVIEGDGAPPPEVIDEVCAACRIKPQNLTVLFAPTRSLAGSVQVVARSLEVALHKAHAVHFPLAKIVDGAAAAPLAPPHPDFLEALGRTNDSIIFGGKVWLFVEGSAEEAKTLAEKLPSNTSRDYGEPFAKIFKRFNGDFYAIDPMLFSPAEVVVTAVESGAGFRSGAVDIARLHASFG